MSRCETNLPICPFYKDGECKFLEANRPKIIAVDLDGVITEVDNWDGHSKFGKVRDDTVPALNNLRALGFKIVIWTCRGDIEKVKKFLDENRIPYDYINDHPWNPPDLSNKIFADFYVDDRAIEFTSWEDVLRKIIKRVERG